MGKVKPQYSQKFREEWLRDKKFVEWLSRVHGDDTRAYCKFCRCTLLARYADILSHSETKKHKSASAPFSSVRQTKLPFKTSKESFEVNQAEGSLALFVSSHCAVMSCDHLSELCKTKFKDSDTASKLQIHRTKCSAVIKNVLRPHFVENMRQDIGDSMYSILIDESTDISVTKFLGITIIYYSDSSNAIISTFLKLAELAQCDAQSIVAAIKDTLKQFGLDLNKLQGVGTDNANVMVGINNGVYKILKSELPHLILVKCVCHSIQIATSSACEMLPRNIEFLVREIYNWFSHSSARQQLYRDIYQTLNDGAEPLKIPRACDTRWLSIEPAVTRIIDQWLELKTHFQITRQKEKCYTSEMLYAMLSDECNMAYLIFLKSILSDVQRVNKNFESNTADPCKLLNDLVVLIQSLMKKIVVPTYPVERKYMSLDFEKHLDPKPYLGYEFEKKVENLRKSQFQLEQENVLRQRCIQFVSQLIMQLLQRLPDNIDILRKISLLSVSNALRAVKESLIPLLESCELDAGTITKISHQWQNLSLVQWSQTTDTVSFWCEVKKYCDASNINPFEELATFALSRLVLPWSNAEVERIFSELNIVKTKARNRMRPEMINSLLSIRAGLRRRKQCCYNYELPKEVLQQIGTTKIYQATASTSTSTSSLVPSVEEDIDDPGLFESSLDY